VVLIKLIVAAAIIIGALIGLARFHRYLRGGGGGLLSGSPARAPKAENTDLEAFIAAYRRGKANGEDRLPSPSEPPVPATPAAPPVAEAGPPPDQAPRAFLQGPAKVLYLVLRAALPDHHVFVYTRLTDVIKPIGRPITPQGRAQFAQARMDFVVCSKDLNVVALLDISDGTRPDDPMKHHLQAQLAAAGIRYVRVAPTAIPKPAQAKQLVYPG
jgi:hypothetical protein